MSLSTTNKKYVFIIVLSIIVVFLLFFSDYLTHTNKISIEKFSSLDKTKVNYIKIVDSAKNTIHLEKKDNNWHLTKPIRKPADPVRISLLFSILSLPSTTLYDAETLNLQELGLKDPKATLTFNGQNFYFGNTDSSGKKRYLMHNHKVKLTTDLIFPLISLGAAGIATTSSTE